MADESKGDASAGMAEMPVIGTGTMEHVDGSHPVEAIFDATLAALKAGSRHIDCAELYKSAPHVGRAVSESGVPRAELWVTSKLSGMPVGAYKEVKARLQAHLKDLQVSHLDLLLVHWPGAAHLPAEEGKAAVTAMEGSPDDLASACDLAWFAANIKEAWANLQRLRADGLCRFVGVSNFYRQHFDIIEAAELELPYANQVYIDAAHPEVELVTYLQSKGVKVIAYRPLAFLPVVEMAAAMGDGLHAALKSAADSIGVGSVHEAVLAVLVARGIVPLAKSADAKRIAANLAAAKATVPAAVVTATLEAGAAPDMIDMCGGQDEFAGALRGLTLAADAAPSADESTATAAGET